MTNNNRSVGGLSNRSFDPFDGERTVERCESPDSHRACYTRSRPSSIIDEAEELQNQLLNFSALANAKLNNLPTNTDADEPLVPPPPYMPSAEYRRRNGISARGRQSTSSRYELDNVSVITTRTTVTFRAVRNPGATPPMLRQSEHGKKFSRSAADLLSNEAQSKSSQAPMEPTEDDKGRGEKGWKGGRRLKEMISLLFMGRKENAGILDRDDVEKVHQKSKSFSFFKAAHKGEGSTPKAATISNDGVIDMITLERIETRKSSIISGRTRRESKRRVSGGRPRQTVRHSKSFAGFRGATGSDVMPPVPVASVAKFEEESDDEIDELTREASQISTYISQTYSYEENVATEED